MGIVQNELIFQYFSPLLHTLSVWGIKPPGRVLRATAGIAFPLPHPPLSRGTSQATAQCQGRVCGGAVPRYPHPLLGTGSCPPTEQSQPSVGMGPRLLLGSALAPGCFWNWHVPG